ncbi:beta-propeller fold lactonase family protein [Mucilaginibacter mali]|uniref:Beta-propeller fold lactonase family protein n=1 Tax=Mucilaginibacter mali TaxID=2740462 RepID=A0A7D4UEW3_9SPHI|nr:beta-propeller fold lactonase family protein [Mucilaginibacter mali]QKJ29496.1 beta-propeller fold lactonase family protein [Mucilaginibacter mali]
MKRFWLIVYTLLVVFLLPRSAIAQITGPAVTNGQMTAPIIWGGPSGCVYNWFNPTTGIGLTANGTGDIAPFKAINNTSTPIMVTITATPTPRPIYAYIPSRVANRVTVINTDDYSIVTQIRVGNNPYGVAVSKDGTRVYVSNLNSNTVSVIDGVNNKWITDIPVGQKPMGLDVSPDGTRLYVANSDDQSIYVIDTTDPAYGLYRLVPFPGHPTAVTVNNDGSSVYIAGDDHLHEYTPFTNKLSVITDSGGADAHQILFSPDGATAYLINYAISRDALDNNRLIYEQTFATVNTQTHELKRVNAGIADLNFGGTLNPDGSRLYMTYPGNNAVSVVNTLSNLPVGVINVGQNPNGIAMTQKGILFVVNYDSNDVWAIEPISNTVLKKIPFTDTAPIAFGNFITGNTCTSSTPITYTFTINPTPPTIVVDGTPDVLSTPANIPSKSTYVDISGVNLTEGIAATFTPPSGFEMSLDDITYTSVPIVIGNGGTPPPVHLYIRIAAGNPVGPLSGTITLKSAGAANQEIKITGTVTPAIPYVIASVAGGTITACEGNASANPKLQQFTVSGTLLTGNINLTAPASFEISRDANSGFSNAISLSPTGETVTSTTIFVRSAASAKGLISGQVDVQSAGATPLQVAVNGVVAAPPKVDDVAPQSRFAGQNTAAVNFTGTGTSYSWTNSDPSIGLPASGDGNIAAFKTINKGSTDAVATITVTPHNDPLAYVAMWNLDSVAVINTLTGKKVNTIRVGQKPYATVVSPDGTTVFVANQNSGTVSIINTAANKATGGIPVGSNPSGLALSPDGSTLYVTNGNSNTVLVIDANSHGILGSIIVQQNPLGVAVSPDGSWVYVANKNNTVSVASAASKQVIYSVTVGSSPQYIAVSPDGNYVYVTNYNSASVSVISTVEQRKIDDIQIGTNPTGIAINKDGSILYVTNFGSNSVSIIRTSDRSIIKTVPTGAGSKPEGISVSPDGKLVYVANYGSNSVMVINTADNSLNTTIPLLGSPVSFGDFIVAGTGCVGNSAQFTITVKPAVQHIFPTGTLTALRTTYGTPSAEISFSVSATDMTEAIKVIPPTGFEVSTDRNTYGSTAQIGGPGAIPSTTIYIRLAATTPVGNNYAGDVLLTSTNVPDAFIATAKSTVDKAPLTITADDQQRKYGTDNPVLTATYAGFVNGEDETVLTALPSISTTAIKTSAPGTYPITVSGGAADNYAIDTKPGSLTVLDVKGIQAIIPNTFSPNGDGVNDTWIIKNIETFPNCTVDIFTRGGQQVYHSVNYTSPWDAKYKGADLPTGVYYYVINLNNGSSPLSGYVAVIR